MRTTRSLLLGAVALLAACETPADPAGPEVAPPVAEAVAGNSGFDPGCLPKKLKETQKGRLHASDCLFTPAGNGRLEDVYSADAVAPGQMATFTVEAEFAGLVGIADDAGSVLDATVRGYRRFPAGAARSFSFIGGPSHLVFVAGEDGTQTGRYTLDATTGPVAHVCADWVFAEAPARFSHPLAEGNSCHVTIQYSPFPEAIGQAIWTQGYNVRTIDGESYTVRLEGLTPAFNPAFTVFDAAGVVAQSAGPVPGDGVRELTFGGSPSRYVYVEVASGQPDGLGGWATPAGTYTLQLTRN